MNQTALILAAAVILGASAMVLMRPSPVDEAPHPMVCEFHESEYLQLNPDVARAVARQEFSSGRAHFEQFGQHELRAQAMRCPGMSTRDRVGLTMSPCDFNETSYLAMNADVASAVSQGAFSSGAAHFVRFGKGEGRRANFDCRPRPDLCVLNESQYLQLNPDVARAVAQGHFGTGAAHYSRFGQSEGRAKAFDCPGTSTQERADLQYPACDFNETRYLASNPDVAKAVYSGRASSGVAHYLRTGRRERRAPYDRCD